MSDVSFAPGEVTAMVGDSVEWKNDDIVDHTATDRAGSFDVDVRPGEAKRARLDHAGRIQYFCRYHPNMTGSNIVNPTASSKLVTVQANTEQIWRDKTLRN
jgi:plastocyanin